MNQPYLERSDYEKKLIQLGYRQLREIADDIQNGHSITERQREIFGHLMDTLPPLEMRLAVDLTDNMTLEGYAGMRPLDDYYGGLGLSIRLGSKEKKE